MLSHKYLIHIRSKDCVVKDQLNTNLQINLKGAIKLTNALQDYHISVASAEIPHSFYAFSSQLANTTLKVDDAVSFTLASGNYDVDEIVKLLTDSSTFKYTCAFDSNTGKITVSNSDDTTHTLNCTDTASKGLYKALGFGIDSDITINASQSYTTPGCVNLATVHSIFVHTNTFNVSNVISTNTMDFEAGILSKIPVDVPPGDILYFSTDSHNDRFSSVITGQGAINSFDLALKDQNGNLIGMNGVNWEITLMIEIHQKELLGEASGVPPSVPAPAASIPLQSIGAISSIPQPERVVNVPMVEANSVSNELQDALLAAKLISLGEL